MTNGENIILPFVYLCGRPGAELVYANSKNFKKFFILY